MFAHSLLDSPWSAESRRGWTTLASFALQSLGIGALFMLPFLHTPGLPQVHLRFLAVPAPPPGPPGVASRPRASASAHSNFWPGVLLPPREIPHGVQVFHEEDAPPSMGEIGIPGGTNDHGSANGVFNSIGNAIATAIPPPPLPAIRRPPVSRMMEGNLVHKVQPDYPPLAKAARIQGPVVLKAIISKSGTIEDLQVLSGHPTLVKAALDAVKQWRYRPHYLNDEPVEVETQVTVNFVLSGG